MVSSAPVFILAARLRLVEARLDVSNNLERFLNVESVSALLLLLRLLLFFKQLVLLR